MTTFLDYQRAMALHEAAMAFEEALSADSVGVGVGDIAFKLDANRKLNQMRDRLERVSCAYAAAARAIVGTTATEE